MERVSAYFKYFILCKQNIRTYSTYIYFEEYFWVLLSLYVSNRQRTYKHDLSERIYIYIIHTYIHTCIHTYIHTYIHIYIHTYIPTLTLSNLYLRRVTWKHNQMLCLRLRFKDSQKTFVVGVQPDPAPTTCTVWSVLYVCTICKCTTVWTAWRW